MKVRNLSLPETKTTYFKRPSLISVAIPPPFRPLDLEEDNHEASDVAADLEKTLPTPVAQPFVPDSIFSGPELPSASAKEYRPGDDPRPYPQGQTWKNSLWSFLSPIDKCMSSASASISKY